MHAHYYEIESFVVKEIDHDNVRKQNLLQLEKVKMPLFTGRIRDYLRFKWTLRNRSCRQLTSKVHRTIKEEKELALIEKNLHCDQEAQRWIAEYPWIRDPKDLPDNIKAAFAKLISTERRLAKNSEHGKVYKEQTRDMVNRGVARKLTKAELKNYRGPIHFISHHEVLKPDSKSTPVRIVFNSSVKYMGHVLNEYWAKANESEVLSQVNSIYDPLGFAGPYTVRAKILMRKLWTYETKLDWDDPIPEEYGREWMTCFSDLPQMERIMVK